MAYVVVNSKYNPFTFDELIKPYTMYEDAYEKQQAAAEDLASKAATLENLSPELDSAELKTYNDWKNQLKSASDQLATSGLSPELRDRIRTLGLYYNTDLAPIEEKMKTRSDLIKEQRAQRLKNPNIFFDIDYDTTPISQITSKSTFKPYSTKDITAEIGTDIYNRLANGEAVPSTDEYLTKYSAGLSDATKIDKIREAIESGASLGTSTYKQKEFENYIKEITAKRVGRRSGGTYTGTAPFESQQQDQSGAIRLYDGTSVIPQYDKNARQYKIKDKNGKVVALPDNATVDDVLKSYYGGDYGYLNVFGSTVPWVQGEMTGPNNERVKTNHVFINNKWQPIKLEAGKTTVLDLYNQLVNKDARIFDTLPQAGEDGYLTGTLSYTNSNVLNRMSRSRSKSVTQYLDDKYEKEDVDFRNVPELKAENIKQMDALEELGVTFNTTVWKDDRGNIVAARVTRGGTNVKQPVIESKSNRIERTSTSNITK